MSEFMMLYELRKAKAKTGELSEIDYGTKTWGIQKEIPKSEMEETLEKLELEVLRTKDLLSHQIIKVRESIAIQTGVSSYIMDMSVGGYGIHISFRNQWLGERYTIRAYYDYGTTEGKKLSMNYPSLGDFTSEDTDRPIYLRQLSNIASNLKIIEDEIDLALPAIREAHNVWSDAATKRNKLKELI